MKAVRDPDENAVTVETVETHEIYAIHQTVRTTYSSQPSPWAEMFFVATEHEQEVPTEKADLKVRITDMPNPAPSEHAEVKVNLVDGEGNVRVPGRFTGQLLDGCIAVGCAVSAGFTTKWVMEAPNNSLQGWMVLTVVMAQIIGIGVLAWHAMRRRQR